LGVKKKGGNTIILEKIREKSKIGEWGLGRGSGGGAWKSTTGEPWDRKEH